MTNASTLADVSPRTLARHGWQPLALGVLWGIAVSAMEAVGLPVQNGGWRGSALVLFSIVPGWCVVGICIAFLAEIVGARLERPGVLAACVVGGGVALGALWSWLYSREATHGLAAGLAAIFPHGVDPFAALAYQTWIVLFYGGFYVVAWRLNYRAERTREVLARAEVARLRAETLLGEARLQLMRGHVEPQLLLRVMTEVEHRYARSTGSADALLGRLVAFLRLAMPTVRGRTSTLADEVALVRAYAALLAEMEGGKTTWTIVGEAPPDVPFPGMLLLPLLEARAAASAAPFAGSLCVTAAGDSIALRVCGATVARSDWIPADLDYRLRVGLSTVFGDAWSIATAETDDASSPALVIALQLPREPSRPANAAGARAAPPTPKGANR